MDSAPQFRRGDSQRRLRGRVRLTDLDFAAPFLPLGAMGFSIGALVLGLASVACFAGRDNGAPPGYQTVYVVRHRSSLSGVLTWSSFCQSLVTTASTSAPFTFVVTLSPTLNGFLTKPEFAVWYIEIQNGGANEQWISITL